MTASATSQRSYISHLNGHIKTAIFFLTFEPPTQVPQGRGQAAAAPGAGAPGRLHAIAGTGVQPRVF